MNLKAQINNIRMSSKSQLVSEIHTKDQKIQSLDRVNKAMNEMLNKVTTVKNNLEKEVLRLQAENAELKKKRWFEFWR
jgi:UDP-glucose 6-dehydrogenase